MVRIEHQTTTKLIRARYWNGFACGIVVTFVVGFAIGGVFGFFVGGLLGGWIIKFRNPISFLYHASGELGNPDRIVISLSKENDPTVNNA